MLSDRYIANINRLWEALGITIMQTQDKDIFTLAAEKIQKLNRFVDDCGTTCFPCEVCDHARSVKECLHCEVETLRKQCAPRT